MKFLLLLLAGMAFNNHLHAQNTPHDLYYFFNIEDTLVGVRNSAGKVIIPAKYRSFLDLEQYDDTVAIKDDIIVIMDREQYNKGHTSHSYGDAYDRYGNLLYHPLFFDNGPDYAVQGMSRCVENGKAGFVNAKGIVTIKPQWDWVSPFNYGYASVCNGCYWDDTKDKEHPNLAFLSNKDTYVINKKGEKIIPGKKPSGPKNQNINGAYYPYPFENTTAEQKLLDSLTQIEAIHKIAFMNYYPLRTGKAKLIQFEILDRNPADKSLTIMGFEWHDGYYSGREDLVFTVNTSGIWVNIDKSNGPVPLATWLRSTLLESKTYFEEHPDAVNKFDADRYIAK